MNLSDFYNGNEFEMYTYLGAHRTHDHHVTFRTYAPNAKHVSLIGSFSDWTEIPMHPIANGQFYEASVPAAEGDLYKYRIYTNDYDFIDHCDPYAAWAEVRPATASRIFTSSYTFHDDEWFNLIDDSEHEPMNIYEVNLGSWHLKEDDEWYSYEELAGMLVKYCKENHYNYLELMPITEFPNDASWGYQPTGYFAPTSRYGTPDQLRYLIDACHQASIGVILDFVPVHFAIDGFALNNYDGTPLYNYPNDAVGKSEWGTCNFQHSRGDVCSFLNSSGYYWLKEFHFDGLRLDAVSNLIFWQGDSNRGVNNNTVNFIKNFNGGLKKRLPHALLFAEDSSSYPGVTKKLEEGGLGFDYKWDLGWMNDTLDYFKKTSDERKENYHKLTFSMYYFYNEHYLLPLSHDEVVHGKKTIIDKMYGEYEDKFKNARAFYMYMFAHPGKKLNFMGNEIAQFREWDEQREQDWDLLKYPIHDAFNHYFKDLSKLYLEHPSLSAHDYDLSGFEWIDCHQEDKAVYVFERCCEDERTIFFFNFSSEEQTYTYTNSQDEHFIPLLDSNAKIYGGENEAENEFDVNHTKTFTLDPLSAKAYLIK
ncbi:MAG: 1,4-alpha-glucan branching protein GlgB [Sharpea porci]|uniref:1,4-alpha-glucan branching protein GlgB n=1 Tax=Sharpea porci TaxID=2652286 RepID=UPI00240A8488|nr:1,4-alpha-glucan branching protein GlgB [Sharpea porci]MDD6711307.1 1,4-alpha-glucan branching protein GlgB [Sharpea porci]